MQDFCRMQVIAGSFHARFLQDAGHHAGSVHARLLQDAGHHAGSVHARLLQDAGHNVGSVHARLLQGAGHVRRIFHVSRTHIMYCMTPDRMLLANKGSTSAGMVKKYLHRTIGGN